MTKVAGYDHVAIEQKWQAFWEEQNTYATLARNVDHPKCYVLDMFPYPSGNSMHVGHPRGYVATDVYSRFKRMNGFRVLHPMGWDSFGLPAEETAIARNEHPSISVDRNISLFKDQLSRLGLSFDWSREITTSDPSFYRHTQRLFLEFFRRGLAYNAMSTVNWCPALGTVLANEDIEDGVSERGGHAIEIVEMRQWILRITAYADRLVDDLEKLPEWPNHIKNAQAAWIGRSKGNEVNFEVRLPSGEKHNISTFTTRLETLAGVTFLAIAPDSPLASVLVDGALNRAQAMTFVTETRSRTIRDRQINAAPRALALINVTATHPLNHKEIPIVLADYVLADHGTGSVMGVPAHDSRDGALAKTLRLPAVQVVDDDGALMNSGVYDGLSSDVARDRIAGDIGADETVQFKIRDWVFSRQRFWGEPIPILWVRGAETYARCLAGAMGSWLPSEPVRYFQKFDDDTEDYLYAVPIIPQELHNAALPDIDRILPTSGMEGPLASIPDWVSVWLNCETGALSTEPVEGWASAKRETNTMPQWAGSSWYWLRFTDPTNTQEPFSSAKAAEWGPVDVYSGADHAVAHLIYARFWQKVMFDAGMVDHDEPFRRLEFLGHILASDGTKISKRKNNSRNPNEIVAEVGADSLRLYEMAIGPFEKAVPWNDSNLVGQRRFLNRIHTRCLTIAQEKPASSAPQIKFLLNTCLDAVSRDIEAFRFNTAVSAMMVFLKESDGKAISVDDFSIFLRMLAPFAPYLAEELWQGLGNRETIHKTAWPETDSEALKHETAQIVVQVNGRKRSVLSVPTGLTDDEMKSVVFDDPKIDTWLAGRKIERLIFVPNKVVNIVLS